MLCQAETRPFVRKMERVSGSLPCAKFGDTLGECIPSPALEAQGQGSGSPREATQPGSDPSLTPEPILSLLRERTSTMGPPLPKMNPQCPGFILKGSGLCDHHSVPSHQRPQIPASFLGTVVLLAWDRGRAAGNHWAPGDLGVQELKGA